MVFDFFPIAEVEGTEGRVHELYLAPIAWFGTIQETDATVAAGDTATIDTAHVFAGTPTPDHGWLSLSLLANNEGVFKLETEGDYPNQKVKTTAEGNLIGLTATQVELLKQGKNTKWLAMVKNGACGASQFWQIGCKCNPVILKGSYSSEDNIFKIMLEAKCEPSFYDVAGALPLEA
jgi:hypothetical protein